MRSGTFLAVLLAATPLFAASRGSATVIDRSGNVWITGASNTLQTTANAFQKTAAATVCGTQTLSPFVGSTAINCLHAFLTKQDSNGKVLYSTYLGGSSQDGGTAITVDAQGNVYIAGYTYSADFPTTGGVVQAKNHGPTTPQVYVSGGFPFGPANVVPGGDAFVAKFAPGGTLVYSTLLGGSGSDVPLLIDVDGAGSVYLAGYTNSSDFPAGGGAITSGHGATYFARLNPAGTALVYATYSDASILAFDVDSQGRAYLTGTGAYVTTVDTAAGRVVGTASVQKIDAKFAGAGVAIAVDAARQNLFLAISPEPVPYSPFTATQYPRQLGASHFLEMPIDASRVTAETDLEQTQFDSIEFDGAGNAYGFGHGTGALPGKTIPLLAAPCSPLGGSFVVETNPQGSIQVATYFRQGNDAAVSVTGPGQMLVYRQSSLITLSSTVVPIDLSSQPVANFGCPENLASGMTGAGLAPGEVFLLTGSGLGPAQGVSAVPDAQGRYPTSLSGVQVTVNGTAVPLLYVQANEIHAVAPFALPNVPQIQVQFGSQSALPLDAWPAQVNPGIFGFAGRGAIVNQDGLVNAPGTPAKLGSIVSIYCTGTGYLEMPVADGRLTPIPPPFITTQLTPRVLFAGVPGTTLWSGSAPGLIFGVTQINVQLPTTLPAATVLSAVPMVLEVSGQQSPPMSITLAQ
jgi:uncharacterized protein (TIGR03437 family)